MLARLRERAPQSDRVSDADSDVLELELAEFEPLDELPWEWRADLRAEAQPAELVADLEAIVDGSLLPAALHE